MADETLSSDTLVLFLKDRAFVEYFNSFLLLPIFSSQVFYDINTGSFQQVSLPQCSDECSLSTSTLYITEEDVSGMLFDSCAVLQWIIDQRLPLFINSDLYSEYLLCHSLQSSSKHILGKLLHDRSTVSGEVRKRSSRQRSSRTRSSRRRSSASHTPRRSNEFEYPGKAEMKRFKMFLKDKSGLKNWLYCIDFTQLRNMTIETDKNKLFREIRERYFAIASSLALSNEVVGAVGCGPITMETLESVFETLFKGLATYWYPRFVLSCLPSPQGHISHTLSLPIITHSSYNDDTRAPHPSDVITPTIRLVSGLKSKPSISRPHTQPSQLREQSPSSRLIWSRSRSSVEPKSVKLAKFNKYPIIPSGRTSVTGTPQPYLGSTSEVQILSVNGTPIALDQRIPYYNDSHKLFMRCLAIEKRKCGGYFQTFLQSLEDKVYLYCLLFWRETQEYKTLFFASDFNPILVETKAKLIYSLYILEYSVTSIDCPPSLCDHITERLWPAFEDIFDRAEEYVLTRLEEKWIELCQKDRESFEHIQTISSEGYTGLYSVTTLNKELDKLSEEYSSMESSSTDSISSVSITSPSPQPTSAAAAAIRGGEGGRVSVVRNRVRNKSVTINTEPTDEDEYPSTDRQTNFNDIIKNPKELEFFKVFLNENNGAIDLKFWLEIESFRSLPSSDGVLKDMKAKKIRSGYFNKTYLFGQSSPFSKETQREIVSFGGSQKLPLRPKSPVFREAQKHIRSRLEKKWIPLFIRTEGYLERHGMIEKSNNESEEETLESFKVYTESEDTLRLKQTLYDCKRCELFRNFLCIKAPRGTNPSNNVDFWLEIQRFKDMFHYQMNASLLSDKMKAILDCYIRSPCNPKLQVNLPPSIAEELVQKTFGPYMFREAQNCIFRYLQTAWEDYQSFCDNNRNKPMTEALTELREYIARERHEAEERAKVKDLMTAAQSPLAHLETEEERKSRKAKERELREFGEIGVSFKLSSPQPNYTYCGQIESLQYKLHPECTPPSPTLLIDPPKHVKTCKPEVQTSRVRFDIRNETIKNKPIVKTGLMRKQRSLSVPSKPTLFTKGFSLRRNSTAVSSFNNARLEIY